MKTIVIELSSSSIKKAIQELEKYAEGLTDKNDLFVKRLAEVGIPVIDKRIAEAQGDSDKAHETHIEINHEGKSSTAVLRVSGKDILFIEFGAGIHYNWPAGTTEHPKGAEFGYTIGSYGKGQGQYDEWRYKDENGILQRSHGTEATMPMYEASLEIKNKVLAIAKEVFNDGK